MRKPLTILLSACCLTAAVLFAAPVRSNLGGEGVEGIPEQDGPTAADYVQDGLVAMYDAIENVGWGLHSNNAYNWKNLVGYIDLLGGESGELRRSRFEWVSTAIRRKEEWMGTAAYGCMQIDRTRLADFVSLMMENQENTVEVCISPASYSGDGFGLQVLYSSGNLYMSQDTNGTQSQFRPLLCSSMTRIRRDATQDRTLSMVSVYDEDGADFVAYANGCPIGTYWSSIGNTPTAIVICDPGFGNAHCFRFYNRALTPEEVAHNAAIDKERFGL